jgi:hypothetical protein
MKLLDIQVLYSPCITRVITPPFEIDSCTLEDGQRWQCSSISTGSFNNGDQLAITIFKTIDLLLVTVNKCCYSLSNPKLNTLLVHVVYVRFINIIFRDNFFKNVKEFIDCGRVDIICMAFLETLSILCFEIGMVIHEPLRP